MENLLITGTTNGIGKRLKEYFIEKGYFVIGVDKENDSFVSDNFLFVHVDLADSNALDLILDLVGDRKLHAIINNAGEFVYNPFKDFSIDKFQRSQLVNATIPIALTAALQSNLEDKKSSVVSITSGDAYFAGHEDVGYASSKASLANITKSMAAELGKRGIRVNAIAPGWVDTDMGDNAGIDDLAHAKTPLGRNSSTQEIVDLIEYLIGDRSSFINGAVINIDGGYTIIDTVVKEEFERHSEEK
jgi:3-oxoacyl-[acyl-carrier protein] reductase